MAPKIPAASQPQPEPAADVVVDAAADAQRATGDDDDDAVVSVRRATAEPQMDGEGDGQTTQMWAAVQPLSIVVDDGSVMVMATAPPPPEGQPVVVRDEMEPLPDVIEPSEWISMGGCIRVCRVSCGGQHIHIYCTTCAQIFVGYVFQCAIRAHAVPPSISSKELDYMYELNSVVRLGLISSGYGFAFRFEVLDTGSGKHFVRVFGQCVYVVDLALFCS